MHRVSVQWSGTADERSEDSDTTSSESSERSKDCRKEQSDETGLPISELDMVLPERILVLGSSESGKTTAIRALIQLMKRTNRVAAVWWISVNHRQETWLPSCYRRSRVSKELLDRIRACQRNREFAGMHQIVVIDDCLTEKFHRDAWWNAYISTCRHDRVTLIFGVQYLKGLSPVVRDNIKRYLCCHVNNGTLKALYDLALDDNWYHWKSHFTGLTRGQPLLMDVRPGKQELTKLRVPRMEPEMMQ